MRVITLVALGAALAVGVVVVWPAARVSIARPEASSVPTRDAALQGPASAMIGRIERGYWIHRLHAANAGQRLTLRFASAGVAVTAGPGRFDLGLAGLGRVAGEMTPVALGDPQSTANRVTYRGSGVSEWFVNGPFGLEQGFAVARRPAGSGALQLRIALSPGVRPTVLSRTAALLSLGAHTTMRYGELTAVDARGRVLPGRVAVAGGRLSIDVQDRGAEYPITVDPLVQQPVLIGSSAGSGAQQGYSVAVSGDGTTALIGAPGYDSGEGAVWVFTNSGSGWTDQAMLTTGNCNYCADANFGWSVALDDNGHEALIGSPALDSVGGAWEFSNYSSDPSTPDWNLINTTEGTDLSRYGTSVAIAGGEGVVGAPNTLNSASPVSHGAVYVYSDIAVNTPPSPTTLVGDGTEGFGDSVAMSDNGTVVVIGNPYDNDVAAGYDGSVSTSVESSSTWPAPTALPGVCTDGCMFGSSVAVSNNGDSLLIGADASNSNDGSAWAYTGTPGSWGTPTELVGDCTGGSCTGQGTGESSGGDFGASVALSGDGTVALIGAPDDSSDEGAAWEFTYGSGAWTSDGSKVIGDCSTPANCTNQGTGESTDGQFGTSVAMPNGSDGTELLIGAPDNDDGSGATGAVWPFVPSSQTATSTALSVPSSMSAGHSVSLIATVSPTPDGGAVGFTLNGSPIAACTAVAVTSSGTATCTTTFPYALNGQLQANYTGDTNFAGSSSASVSATIGPGTTSITISTPSTTIAGGAPVTFTAKVSPVPDGGSVTWSANSQTIDCTSSSAALSGGTATCTAVLNTSGPLSVQAEYTGDADYVKSFSNTLHETVSAPFNAKLLTAVGTGTNETLYSTPCGSTRVEIQVSGQTESGNAPYTVASSGDTAGLTLSPGSGSIPHDGTVTLTLRDAGQNSGTATYTISVSDPNDPSYVQPLKLTVSHAHLPVAQGLWVTQGIQPDYDGLDPSGDGTSGDLYQGVFLVAGKTTIVRFYANAPNSPGGIPVQAELFGYGPGHHPLPGSPMDSVPSTLPDLGPAAGPHDSVTRAELLSNSNAFTFTLPLSWVTGGGNGSLPGPTGDEFVGKVLLQDASAPSNGQCEGSDSFALTAVGFLQVDNLYGQYDNNPALTIVPMKVNGSKPVPGATALQYPDAVFPLSNGALGTGAWTKGIDISDIADGPAPAKGQPSKTSLAMARLQQTFPNQAANHIHTVGMTSDANDFGRGLTSGNGTGFSYYSVVAFNPFTFGGDRPLTTLSHEIGHQFGLEHASEECGGEASGGGVPWVPTETIPGEATPLIDPTDGVGTLDGIGLNTTSEPYQFIADGATETLSAPAGYSLVQSSPYPMSTSGTSQAYDFMSYCTPERGGDDPGNWLSPQYWTHMIFNFNNNPGESWYTSENGGPPTYGNGSFYSTIVPNPPFAADRAAGRRGRTDAARIARAQARSDAESNPLAATATVDPGRLDVLAIAQGAAVSPSGAVTSSPSVSIASVFPQIGTALPNGSTGDSFTLTTLGATGQVIASVPMSTQDGHIDVGSTTHGAPSTPGEAVDILSANVPAAGVDSVQLSSDGQVLATRKRPALAPRVTVTAPRRGQHVGAGSNVLLRWRATDPEHLPLLAFIDYSTDGGRSWRTIYSGPNHGSFSLPSSFFTASKRARVRVRISDGWNQPSALSPIFVAIGAPPQVTILSTFAKTMRFANDAHLQLNGQAVDQAQQTLKGRQLVWYDGPFRLGTGASLSAGPLPAGVNHIRLVARDPQGRTVSASITLHVTKAKLAFLKLLVPARAGRKARSVTITATSAIPATLAVGRHHVKLKARKRAKLVVPIARGRASVLLPVSVSAAGLTTPLAYVVQR